jgi:hypothetical protein
MEIRENIRCSDCIVRVRAHRITSIRRMYV